MHIADVDKGMLGANGIVGGGLPLACRRGADREDARAPAASRSASSATAPPTRARSTRRSTWPRSGSCPSSSSARTTAMPNRPRSTITVPPPTSPTAPAPTKFPGVVVDGLDLFSVYEAAGEAIARARRGEGPTLIEAKTYRYLRPLPGRHGHLSHRRRARHAIKRARSDPAVRALRDRARPGHRRTSSTRSTTAIESSSTRPGSTPRPPHGPEPEEALDRRLRFVLAGIVETGVRSHGY